MNSTRVLKIALLVGVFAAATSCKNQRPDPPFGIESGTPEGQALQAWFAGEELPALSKSEAAGDNAEALFVKGEVASEMGEVEKAFDYWTALLRAHPDHALARTVAARLYASRNEIIDFEQRVWSLFDEVEYAKLQPLTRVYVSMLHQTIAFRRWKRSDSNEPFDSDTFGFPAKWLKTPTMSMWRLGDFDTTFGPEKTPVLARDYVSPATAVDVPKNREDVEPYWTTGITLYPGFSSSGVHYLETWATVDGTGSRDYLLYGNFTAATRVWIDGELVFEREESDYDTGKRLRRIRLEPGSHRILVKTAYQSGYRDWFDLSFIPEGTSTDNAGLTFQYRCLPDRSLPDCLEDPVPTDGLKLVTDTMRPSELEPIFVKPENVADATDIALWITMVNAYFDGEHQYFRAAWDALSERRTGFAAGWAMWAEQVTTLWQVPSRLRDARSLQALRKAYELNPDSVRYMSELGARLTKNGEDREARALLQAAVAARGPDDGAGVRSLKPLVAWAQYLDDKNWRTESEKAWRAVLAVDPSHCQAAREVQSLLYGRRDYVRPEEITPRSDDCPDLAENFAQVDDANVQDRLLRAKRDLGRQPLNAGLARNVARLLWQNGSAEQARKTIESALAVNPDSASLRAELADRAFADGRTNEALAVLEKYEDEEGTSSWLLWKRANMVGKLPLVDIMPDGLAAAKKAVTDGQTKSLSNDEAYFVVDFAAREYFPDGSHLTLTHTVVRVMTKNAIDRYGEQNLPSGARPLLVRTIKEDGTTRVPAETSGKSTLSMPGLAEGDFVEVAYLEYGGESTPASQIEGVRFFFQMDRISTLHSEYVIVGDIADFMLMNDSPQPQKFTYDGKPAVRFLAKNNPRPRAEPRSVPSEEYLPWVQMYRQGHTLDEIDVYRRDVAEAIRDSSKSAEAFESALARWTSGEIGAPGSTDWLKQVFYKVAGHIAEPSISPRSFNTDVNHAVLEKDGNSMLVLKKVLDEYDVPNDVYLVKSAYQVPTEYPIREDNKYANVLLRVEPTDGEPVWLVPDGPDAMFNAVSDALIGQPAICATCADREEQAVPDGVRRAAQLLEADTKLTSNGELTGRLTFRFDGTSAASIRSGLRGRTDETSREKFVDSLAAGMFPGSAAIAYDIQGELSPDAPLVILVDFRRPDFARDLGNGTFQIEETLFRSGIASVFAALPERTTPLMVGFPMRQSSRWTMDTSAWSNVEIVTRSGAQTFDSQFGRASRSTTLQGEALTVAADIDMPIQRVPTSNYQAFQQWALSVEQSAKLQVRLK